MYERPEKTSNFEDVGMFHEKFGLDNTTIGAPGPREVPEELMTMRLNFLLEELKELVAAVGGYWEYSQHLDKTPTLEIKLYQSAQVDHPEALDALLDLAYVTFGTAHLLGYPWQEGWQRVQYANMAKVRAKPDASDSKRGSSFDVVKPYGWAPPDHRAMLVRHGWPEELFYGHKRDGTQCAPELCGSPQYDPCTYTPKEIARFERLEAEENK